VAPDLLLDPGRGAEVSHGVSSERARASFRGRDGRSHMRAWASHQRHSLSTVFL
jgi:pyridoxine/pyridoxamine 5'-phosphate oxidase